MISPFLNYERINFSQSSSGGTSTKFVATEESVVFLRIISFSPASVGVLNVAAAGRSIFNQEAGTVGSAVIGPGQSVTVFSGSGSISGVLFVMGLGAPV